MNPQHQEEPRGKKNKQSAKDILVLIFLVVGMIVGSFWTWYSMRPHSVEEKACITQITRVCYENGSCYDRLQEPEFKLSTSHQEMGWMKQCEDAGYPNIRTQSGIFLGCTRSMSLDEVPVMPELKK